MTDKSLTLQDLQSKFEHIEVKLKPATREDFLYHVTINGVAKQRMILYRPFWYRNNSGHWREDFLRPASAKDWHAWFNSKLKAGEIYVTIINNERILNDNARRQGAQPEGNSK